MESEYFSAISTKLDLLKLCLPTNTVHFWNHLSFNHIPYSICYKKFPDLKYRYLIFPKSTFPQHAPPLQTEYCSMKLRWQWEYRELLPEPATKISSKTLKTINRRCFHNHEDTKKAPTMAFFWLKACISIFTFKTLLPITIRSLC